MGRAVGEKLLVREVEAGSRKMPHCRTFQRSSVNQLDWELKSSALPYD